MASDADDLRQRLARHVEILAEVIGERSGRRPTAIDAARSYLVRELSAMGCDVARDPYETPIRPAENVEVVFPGSDPARPTLVVGSHYDTVPGTPGADDNASAVAINLEVARTLVAMKRRRRPVRVVFYDCEEPPFFATIQMGSRRHARQCRERGERLTGMICLESLGYYVPRGAPPPLSDDRLARLDRLFLGGRSVVLAGNAASLGFFLRFAWAFGTSGLFPCVPILFPRSSGVASLSDHRCYWAEGYPAVMLTDTALVRNPNYHLASDRLATLDLPRMARVAAQVCAAVRRMAR